MKLFDTHAHIGLIYDDPIEQLRVIQQAKLAGVARIMSINNSLMDFEKVYNNLKAMPGIYHAVGVAPSEVTTPGKDWIKTIEEGLKNGTIKENTLLPLKAKLAYYFGVGEGTVQNAVRKLEDEGLVITAVDVKNYLKFKNEFLGREER